MHIPPCDASLRSAGAPREALKAGRLSSARERALEEV
jgi:hypothetical protein